MLKKASMSLVKKEKKKKKKYTLIFIKAGIYVTLLLSQTYGKIMSKVGSQECRSLRGGTLKAAFVEIRLRTECIPSKVSFIIYLPM